MHPRRDMKKARRTLGHSALIIFLGEILAGFLIDRTPLEVRFPDAYGIIRTARQRDRSPDIIFFGTSRFQTQYNAKIIEQELAKTMAGRLPSVLNAGVSYGDLVLIDFLVAKLLQASVRPSFAVIEVSPEAVSRRNMALGVHLIRQFTWVDILNSLPDVFDTNREVRLLYDRITSPVYVFRHVFRQWALEISGLRSMLWPSVQTTDPTPTETPQEAYLASEERLFAGARTTRHRLRNFQVGGISTRALERVIERYKKLGVTTILVAVSISSPVRKEYGPEIDAAFLSYMHKLKERYGVYFIDYRDRVPDELFKAGYYTTEAGTSYVSRLVARETLAPLWRNRSSGSSGAGTEIDTNPLSDVEGYLYSQKAGGSVEYKKPENR